MLMMKKHWNEIQPIDHYSVKTNGIVHEYDKKVITLLYQPLIGAACYSLYMTLFTEVEENRLWSGESTHYHLMNFLSLNLQNIYEARLKLEGIGLLKTFQKTEDDKRIFIYELQRPLSPDEFFYDGMLNVYLYRKIGKSHFTRLKHFFTDSKINQGQFSEITRSFQDVYTSTSEQNVDFLHHEANIASKTDEKSQYIYQAKGKGVELDDVNFDFSLLLSGLSESMVPRKAFTNKVKETVLKLSYLYGIDPIQMKNVILSSLTADDSIDIEVLRKSARDWYQLQTGDVLPELTPHLSTKGNEKEKNEPLTKEGELIEYLESTSPKDVLSDISNGGKPSKADMQAVEEVLMTQKLSIGVMNVLIQYVLLKTDMKLTKGYMEKIASHWKRKKVTTAKEAMELAKKEHKQYLEWAQGKDGKQPSGSRRKPIRTEKLPDWFTEEDKSSKVKPSKDQSNLNFEEEKRKLEEELKNFRK
jgi:replication initiation and membrane attachment protein